MSANCLGSYRGGGLVRVSPWGAPHVWLALGFNPCHHGQLPSPFAQDPHLTPPVCYLVDDFSASKPPLILQAARVPQIALTKGRVAHVD